MENILWQEERRNEKKGLRWKMKKEEKTWKLYENLNTENCLK